METDLNRSLRILENAISTKDSSLLHSARKAKSKKNVNLSLSLTPDELKQLEFGSTLFSDTTLALTPNEIKNLEVNKSRTNAALLSMIEGDKTLTGTILLTNKPWTTAAENLYVEFFEVHQSHSQDQNIFGILSELACCCSDALNVIKGLKSKIMVQGVLEEVWLEKERNIWRLLFVLLQDRFTNKDEDEMNGYYGESEKLCILNLFKRDGLLRECQLVIDWLECNASENDDEVLYFSDNSVGWENTLHQLKSPETIVFESSRKIVSRLDPDAPHCQKLPLHDIDMSDEDRLCRKVFSLIRCGKLKDAQKLCVNCGHAWRAALLEGWRLYHNPNLHEVKESEDMEIASSEPVSDEKNYKVVEGNQNRDIWKNMALQYCEKSSLHLYERAAVAAYCGHLESLLAVCKTWEDSLWAYMRVLVDIRVESELRDSINRSYKPLKDSYWEQRMSLNEVFSKIESSPNENIRFAATLPDYKIQKYIILDDLPQLLEEIKNWVNDSTISTQFLRFATHLVLFLEEIGLVPDRSIFDNCLEMYLKHLCELNETQLIAYYVSKLDSDKQIDIYASYLERITEDAERKEALEFGENCGLDTKKVTKRIVVNIRNRPHEITESRELQERLTDDDNFKISSLDWLLIYDSQRLDALEECNALIFTFLTLGKLDGAKAAFMKIPPNAVDMIISAGELSPRSNQTVREHLSYKTYFDAHEAFTAWFEQYNSKPIPPGELHENAQFTEKVAHQHRVSQHKAELERWRLSCSHLAKLAKTLLYNVLLFPEGWLTGAKDEDFMRSKCIPEVVLLLFTVLYESGLYEECIQLADLLASEKHGLYKVYSQEQLESILIKLSESSVALLNERKDPWGQEAVV